MTLQSQNPFFGFYGTIRSDLASLAWPMAMDLLRKESGAREEYTRAFLDSRLGRCFADNVNDNVRCAKDLTSAIQQAILECNSWKLHRSDVVLARFPGPSRAAPSVIKAKVWSAGHYMVSDLYNETLEGMRNMFDTIRFRPVFEQLLWDYRQLDIIKLIDDMPQDYHGVLFSRLRPYNDPQNHLVLQFGIEQDSLVFKSQRVRDQDESCPLAEEKIPLREWEKALISFRNVVERLSIPDGNVTQNGGSGPKKALSPK